MDSLRSPWSPTRPLTRALLGAVALALACGDDGDTTGASASETATTGETSEGTSEGSASTTATTAATDATDATATATTAGTTASTTATSETTGPTTGDPACPDVAATATIVPTTSGAVEGELLPTGVVAFRGIAYAEPPLADLRWRPPTPRACQAGVTPAQEFGPRCVQPVKDAQGNLLEIDGDEDCLTLNVWTPAADDGARPVMVFIHGGGNAVGGAADELYDGARLAEDRGVVVVTLNYRLGALGWLTHPSLAQESADGVSGNYALQDQIAALRWVRDNVTGFGGDPARVTVFGQSAGAVNTCAVVGAPAASGLFAGAIVQSGACVQRPLARYQMDMGDPFVANSGCADEPDLPACLRALPADTVAQTDPDGYPNVAGLEPSWGPHVDGVVLPKSTLDAMMTGAHNVVPFVVGDTAAETAQSVPPLTEAQYTALVQATFGPLAAMVLAHYPTADYGGDAQATYVALSSDLKFVCNTRKSARAAAATGKAPVYRYHFAFDNYTALPGVTKAAFHGLELVYLFGNFDAILDGNLEYQPNADDLVIAETMGAAWSAFAATGDPSAAMLPWATYVIADDNATLLDVPTGTIDGVRTAQCDFWDSLL